MIRPLNDRPPCLIEIAEIGMNQWTALSEIDGDVSGATDWVDAVARGLEWAALYGDAVELVPYRGDRMVLLRASSAACLWSSISQ